MDQTRLAHPAAVASYLRVGGSAMLNIEAQGFVPAALPDEVGGIKGHIFVQNLEILQRGGGGGGDCMLSSGCVQEEEEPPKC